MRLNVDMQIGKLVSRVRRSDTGDETPASSQASSPASPDVRQSPDRVHSEGMHNDRPSMADGATDAAMRIARMTDDVLLRALRTDAHGRGPNPDLQRALRQLCAEARDQGLRAEQLLILMKSRWRRVSEARRASRDAANGMFAAVVTLCIREYYAGE